MTTTAGKPVAFDQVAIGASLVLTVQNTTLQTSVTGADAHRMCRSQFGLGATTDTGSVEFYFWSPNAATPSLVPSGGVPPLVMGMALGTASLSKYVGEDANAYGYCPGDGNVYKNGAAVVGFGLPWSTAPLGSYIRCTWDAHNQSLTWSLGDTVLGTITGVAAGTWFYAATVSGNPGDLAIEANAGQWPMAHPDLNLGFFHISTGITPTYVCNEPYITAPTDARPNQRYAGDLDRSGSPPSISRAADFWFWGTSKPSTLENTSSVAIPLNDPAKIYEQFMILDVRDQVVTITRNQTGRAAALAEAIFVGIIDRCEQPTDQTKTLFATDKLSLFDQQLVRPKFPPNADPALAGKPLPTRLGINRNFTPPSYDTTNHYYAGADAAIAAVGKSRVQGKEEAYGIDFSLLADQKNFSRSTDPAGKWQLETTDYGGAYSSAAPDLLSGDGVFASVATDGGGTTGTSTTLVTVGTGTKSFTMANPSLLSFKNGSLIVVNSGIRSMTGTVTSYNSGTGILQINVTATSGSGSFASWTMTGGVGQPHNWTAGGGYPTDAANTIFQVIGSSGSQTIQQQQSADAVYWLKHQAMTVAPGAAVAFEVVVTRAPYFGAGIDAQGNPITISPANIIFDGIPSQTGQFYPWGRFTVDAARTYRGSFINNQSVTLPLVLHFLCNNMVNNSPVNSALEISSIKVVSLPSITQNVLLLGPGLDRLLQQLYVERGPIDYADYDTNGGAAAIDAATGYVAGLSISPDETPSVKEAAKPLLDSFGACVYQTRAGKVTAFRLTAPELATSVTGTLTRTNFAGYLTPKQDLAENLTTRAQGTRNVDPATASDFQGQSLQDVPQLVRNLLMAKFQTTCTAGVVVSSMYSAANRAQPLQTCLDRAADIQAEITRVCSLYTSPRHFYTGKVFSPLGTLFEIGQVWNVIYPTGNLTTGKQLVIVGVQEEPTEEISTLTFWGL
jgi:hypothetical protein